MRTNNFENVHFGQIVKNLVTEKKLSVDADLVNLLSKSRTAIFDDFKKEDMSVKTLLTYFEILDIKACDVFLKAYRRHCGIYCAQGYKIDPRILRSQKYRNY